MKCRTLIKEIYSSGMVTFSVTLARHGETAHNKDNVIQGQLDVPLSAIGNQQANELGFHLRNQHYTHVYVSDLSRAKQTADGILNQNLFFNGRPIFDSRLRERKFGIIEGKSFRYLKQAAENASKKIGNYTPPGGETIEEVHNRVVLFFQELCQTMTSSNIIVGEKPHVHNSKLHTDISKKPVDLEKDNIKNSKEKSPCTSKNSLSSSNELKTVPSVNIKITSENLFNTDNISTPPNLICKTNKSGTISKRKNVKIPSGELSSLSDGAVQHMETSANVLIVTHCGVIRELLRYFIEELNCSIPGGKHQALRISPNAALSRFTVAIEENQGKPKIICHQIHDKEYVVSNISKKISMQTVSDTAM